MKQCQLNLFNLAESCFDINIHKGERNYNPCCNSCKIFALLFVNGGLPLRFLNGSANIGFEFFRFDHMRDEIVNGKALSEKREFALKCFLYLNEGNEDIYDELCAIYQAKGVSVPYIITEIHDTWILKREADIY